MSAIAHAVNGLRARARAGRATLFRTHFRFGLGSRVLDIGSGDGTTIAAVLQGAGVPPGNVYIANVNGELVDKGHRLYGFAPVVIPESGRLPFDDGFFDVVFCSSLIARVARPNDEVGEASTGPGLDGGADTCQTELAAEIRRLGRGYFVQVPNRWFPIESQTWLPFGGYLPRRVLIPLLRLMKRSRFKATSPDPRLLTVGQMRRLFPDARIVRERVLGMTKSIIAIKS